MTSPLSETSRKEARGAKPFPPLHLRSRFQVPGCARAKAQRFKSSGDPGFGKCGTSDCSVGDDINAETIIRIAVAAIVNGNHNRIASHQVSRIANRTTMTMTTPAQYRRITQPSERERCATQPGQANHPPVTFEKFCLVPHSGQKSGYLLISNLLKWSFGQLIFQTPPPTPGWTCVVHLRQGPPYYAHVEVGNGNGSLARRSLI